MEIKIEDVRMKNKGVFVLTCDAEITLYNLDLEPVVILLRELKYFEKGKNIWVNMPSRDWEKDGERQYKILVRFPNDETWEKVKDLICTKIQEHLSPHNNKEPEQTKEEIPF